MEARVFAERLCSRARGGRREHGRVVLLREGRADGTIAMHVDLGAQTAQVVEQVVHLLLQTRDVRRHLLELVALLEAVATIGRIHALEIEVAASLTRRLPIALDLAALAFIACDADVAIALRPWLRSSVVALPLLGRVRVVVLGAHCVAAVGYRGLSRAHVGFVWLLVPPVRRRRFLRTKMHCWSCAVIIVGSQSGFGDFAGKDSTDGYRGNSANILLA